MNDSKLIQILKTLTKTEWKEFEKFSSSVYFNKGRNYQSILKILKTFYPRFDSDILTKKYLYKKLFPSKAYKEGVIKVSLSGLTSLAEKFLGQVKFEENTNEQNKLLNDSLIERRLYSLFDSNYKISLKALNEKGLRNNVYFHFKYFFEKQRCTKSMIMGNSIYGLDEMFIQFDKDMRYCFLHELCRVYQPIINQKYNFQNERKHELFDFVMAEIEKDFESCPRTLHCYYFNFKLMEKNEKEYFDKLYECVKELENVFESSELRNFYISLANCISVLVRQDRVYVKEYFEIINILSEKNILIREHGFVDPHSLINIVLLASEKEYFEPALNLVEKNYQKIMPGIRDDVYSFCIGVIEQHKQNYETALALYAKIQPYDAHLKIIIDTHRLIIFYELKHFENAISLSDSFIHFIKNHKEINQAQKDSYNDFIKNYRKLLKLNSDNYDEIKFSSFRIKIESKNTLMMKKWFTQKLMEIKTND